MLLLLIACWSPSTYAPLPPPESAEQALEALRVATVRPEDAGAPGGPEGEEADPEGTLNAADPDAEDPDAADPADADPDGADPDAADPDAAGPDAAGPGDPDPAVAAPVAPPDDPFEPYAARTTRAPLTLVDDQGKVVKVLLNPQTRVQVLAAEATRLRVRCEPCLPKVEGWVQVASVEAE